MMEDNAIRLVVKVFICCNVTALEAKGVAHIQFEGLPEWPKPEQYGGHVFITVSGNGILEMLWADSSLHGTRKPAGGWFIIHEEQSHKAPHD